MVSTWPKKYPSGNITHHKLILKNKKRLFFNDHYILKSIFLQINVDS